MPHRVYLASAICLALWPAVAVAHVYSRDEPIAFIGHGTMFDRAGSAIIPSLQTVGEAQAWYRHALSAKLTPAQGVAFAAFEATLSAGLALDSQSQLVLNAALIDWLLDHTSVPGADRIRGKNALLKYYLERPLPEKPDLRQPGGEADFAADPELLRRLARVPATPLLLTGASGDGYRKLCLENGVPIPPDFGTGSAWVDQGRLEKSELFLNNPPSAEVLTWVSAPPAPPGMCIALPRFRTERREGKTPDALPAFKRVVSLDGVVCLGQTAPGGSTAADKRARACFWDNEKNGKFFSFELGTTKTFDSFGGGAELQGASGGGVCSDCHAGENPFVMHGKLLLSLDQPPLSLPTTAPSWHDPIVRNGDVTKTGAALAWPQNPGPMDSPDACVNCHGTAKETGVQRLPQLSTALPDYCGLVLRASIGALGVPFPGQVNPPASMPPGKRAGTLACTPGLAPTDPRYHACKADVTQDCTPNYPDGRQGSPAYKVSCTKQMADLLALCAMPPK
jgi:hypothetical protein